MQNRQLYAKQSRLETLRIVNCFKDYMVPGNNGPTSLSEGKIIDFNGENGSTCPYFPTELHLKAEYSILSKLKKRFIVLKPLLYKYLSQIHPYRPSASNIFSGHIT